ncbi:MAG: hypothetical protein R3F34_08305 [Planctomycetota bacterium]
MHVTRDGAPIPSLLVSATCTSVESSPWSRDNRTSSLTDQDGAAVLTQLTTGTWRLRVHDVADTFGQIVPGEFTFGPGELVELSVDVSTVRGTLEVKEANGAAVAGRRLFLLDATGYFREVAVEPDGTLALELGIGSYELALLDEAATFDRAVGVPPLGPRARFEWTAAGPSVDMLVLEGP